MKNDSVVTGNNCATCHSCITYQTGGICPITECPKSILNGPCGGMMDSFCEVGSKRLCAWVRIYEELTKTGKEYLFERELPCGNYRLYS